jgi:hypothetical protein
MAPEKPRSSNHICELPCVLVFDNEDLKTPFRQVAVCANGKAVQLNEPVPSWLKPLL